MSKGEARAVPDASMKQESLIVIPRPTCHVHIASMESRYFNVRGPSSVRKLHYTAVT